MMLGIIAQASMESHWENKWFMLNRILPLTESLFPLLRYWMTEWSRAQEKHGIRRKWPNRRSFSDITISILEWLFLVFWLNITIFQVGKYDFSDGEAIRDTVKTQLTLCYIYDIMSDHDVYCPLQPEHITFIVFHRYQRLTTIWRRYHNANAPSSKWYILHPKNSIRRWPNSCSHFIVYNHHDKEIQPNE